MAQQLSPEAPPRPEDDDAPHLNFDFTEDATESESAPLLPANSLPTKRRSFPRAFALAFTAVAAVVLLLLGAAVLGARRNSHGAAPPLPLVPPAPLIPKNVTYNRRAVHINGAPELLFTATIHYARSDPSLWPALMHRIKQAGNNAIDTSIFWNLHEPEEGVYDFENGIANLPLFLQCAHDAGLYVVLRIGPYACAEWHFGGFPVWLIEKPGIELRTWNEPYLFEMKRFVEKTLAVVDKYLAPKGGPVILLQIENEYGNIEDAMGPRGSKYIQWAGEYANSLNAGVPWVMCRQTNVPSVLNTENGYYADNWIDGHHKRFPNQPAIVSELWTGWFQKFGQPKFTRYSEDFAFASARFIAKGGTYIGYYMWHGGTNFGKWGSDWKTASYDYDALLNEYGFPNNPKHDHLAEFHHTLNAHKDLILANEPRNIKLDSGNHAEVHVFGDLSKRALVFISNDDASTDMTVTFEGMEINLPRWSVTIFLKDSKGFHQLYCTFPKPATGNLLQSSTSSQKIDALGDYISSLEPPSFQTPERSNYLHQLQYLSDLAVTRSNPSTTDLIATPDHSKVFHIFEPIGIYDNDTVISSQSPREQIRTTIDKSDYLWYVRRNINTKQEAVASGKSLIVHLERLEDVGYVHVDGVKVHDGGVFDIDSGLSPEGRRPARPVDLEVPLKSLLLQSNETRSMSAPGVKSHELSILVGIAGLVNYGPGYEKVRKGLLGAVRFGGQDITKGEWFHQVGLKGERLQYASGSLKNHPWQNSFGNGIETRNVGLVWYLIKISKSKLLELHDRALQTQLVAQKYNVNTNLGTKVTPITAFSLNLSTMSRGMAFVNGNAVGRYWNLKAICNNVPCRYPDSAMGGGESCAVGCGLESQSWYNVPTAWVMGGISDEVEIVLFDEMGGDPLGVVLAAISG
ncbi:glycosyl hydrolases family 35-domain-containing protein [Obelidium mucronatum]|nr:glycosyl hydrolases family 35-domain-containing protein [Obelidium mucronatum]